MFALRALALALGAAVSLGAAGAHASVMLDFSNLTPSSSTSTLLPLSPGMTDIGGGISAQISAEKGPGDTRRVAVLNSENWPRSEGGARRDPDLQSPFQNVDDPTEFINFGNVLIIQEKDSEIPDDQAGGGIMTFVFNKLVDIVFVDLLDVEEGSTITLFGAGGRTITSVSGGVMKSGCTGQYDGSLASGNLNCNGNGPNQFDRYELNAFDVARMEVDFKGSGAVGQIAVVPLPAAILLMLGGVGGLAGVRQVQNRRRAA